jgi:hypothetical protein
MALPIKETPILKGKDAKKFIRSMISNESYKTNFGYSKQAYERARRIYEEIRRKHPDWVT